MSPCHLQTEPSLLVEVLRTACSHTLLRATVYGRTSQSLFYHAWFNLPALTLTCVTESLSNLSTSATREALFREFPESRVNNSGASEVSSGAGSGVSRGVNSGVSTVAVRSRWSRSSTQSEVGFLEGLTLLLLNDSHPQRLIL